MNNGRIRVIWFLCQKYNTTYWFVYCRNNYYLWLVLTLLSTKYLLPVRKYIKVEECGLRQFFPATCVHSHHSRLLNLPRLYKCLYLWIWAVHNKFIIYGIQTNPSSDWPYLHSCGIGTWTHFLAWKLQRFFNYQKCYNYELSLSEIL